MNRSDLVRRLVFLVVWGTWAVMSVVALFYVYRYGSNVPSWDDWDMIPTMTRHQPVTFEWLWSQHNEHRIPVARLAMLGLCRIWPDFRTGMVANVILMSLLAFGLIHAAGRIRGHLELGDVFLPLAVLGLAQGLNYIWSWQIEFMLSTALAGIALLCIALYPLASPLITALQFGALVVLLAMSGAHGLALVPALSFWLLVLAIWGDRSGSTRKAAQPVLDRGSLGALYRDDRSLHGGI